jgi:hypothetical protein
MSEREDPHYQGVWELVEPERRHVAGRKDGKSGRNFVDIAAFGRLLKLIQAKERARQGKEADPA